MAESTPESEINWLIYEYKTPRNDGYVTSEYKKRLQEIATMIDEAILSDDMSFDVVEMTENEDGSADMKLYMSDKVMRELAKHGVIKVLEDAIKASKND